MAASQFCGSNNWQFLHFLGVAYAFPDARGFGGNTTTAQIARKTLSSPVLRQRLVDLCPDVYRQAMEQILLNDLTILRLMSCGYLLLPSKIGKLIHFMLQVDDKILLEVLCREQMKLQLVDIGGWIRFPETVHELYAHLHQFIGKS